MEIDTFWEAFASSKCKTAMLMITFLICLGFVISEILARPSEPLRAALIVLIGYWSGRTSKAQENRVQKGIEGAAGEKGDKKNKSRGKKLFYIYDRGD